ncbi:hypothetical protein E4U28_008481 [Claviceps purpurea]|nr:hypothetical protein E4U28_008481 [Claviceps purpurea]
MIVNCKEILVLPSTTQWNGVVSRLDIVAGKLDSLHEGVNTRLDTMTTRLNSMESNMNTRFDRLDTQLMMIRADPTVTKCLHELGIAPGRTREERSRQLEKAYGA